MDVLFSNAHWREGLLQAAGCIVSEERQERIGEENRAAHVGNAGLKQLVL